MYLDACVVVCTPMCMCKAVNDGCHVLSLSYFFETESLNLELGWWPETPSGSPDFTPHSVGIEVFSKYTLPLLFRQDLLIKTQILYHYMLGLQVRVVMPRIYVGAGDLNCAQVFVFI